MSLAARIVLEVRDDDVDAGRDRRPRGQGPGGNRRLDGRLFRSGRLGLLWAFGLGHDRAKRMKYAKGAP